MFAFLKRSLNIVAKSQIAILLSTYTLQFPDLANILVKMIYTVR